MSDPAQPAPKTLGPSNKNEAMKKWMDNKRFLSLHGHAIRTMQAKRDGLIPLEEAARINREEMENIDLWDTKDVLKGVGNGINNFGVSAINLVGGAFGAESASNHLNKFGNQSSVAGSLSSGIVQWLTSFGTLRGISGATKGAKDLLKQPFTKGKKAADPKHTKPATRGQADIKNLGIVASYGVTGIINDFVAWDPGQGNLTHYLETVAKANDWETRHPAFWGGLRDYLAVNPEDFIGKDAEYSDRLKARLANTGEGALLGGALGTVVMLARNVKVREVAKHYERRLAKTVEKSEILKTEFNDLVQSSKGVDLKNNTKLAEDLGLKKQELVDNEKAVKKYALKLEDSYKEAVEKRVFIGDDKILSEIDTSSPSIGRSMDARMLDASSDAALPGWNKLQPDLGVPDEVGRPSLGEMSSTVNNGKNYKIKIDKDVTDPDTFIKRLKGEEASAVEKDQQTQIELSKYSDVDGTVNKAFSEKLNEPLVPLVKGKYTKESLEKYVANLKATQEELGDPNLFKTEDPHSYIASFKSIEELEAAVKDPDKFLADQRAYAEIFKKESVDPMGLEKPLPKNLKASRESRAREQWIWSQLKNEFPEEEIRKMVQNPEQIKQLLISKERAFIRGGGVPVKADSSLILNKDSMQKELEAWVEALSEVKWQSPQKYGGRAVNLDLSKPNIVAARRGNLYEIGADGNYIALDSAAIVKDSQNDFSFIKGMQVNPVTKNVTAASADELEIFQQLGVDPSKFVDALKKQAGTPENSAKMYQKFFELRARHIARLAAKHKVKLDTISINNPVNAHILTQATHDAIFNSFGKGGLDLAFNTPKGTSRYKAFKLDSALQVTPKGQIVDMGYVENSLFAKQIESVDRKTGKVTYTTGLDKFGKMVDQFIEAANKVATAKTPEQHELAAKSLTDLIADSAHRGDLWNFQTQGSNLDSNAVAAALAKVFDTKFASKFPTQEDFAISLGWQGKNRGSTTARQFILQDLNHTIGVLSEKCKVPREELIEVLSRGDKGVFEGANFKSIDLTPEELIVRDLGENLNYGDIRTLHSRALALRVRIQGRGSQLLAMQKKVTKNRNLWEAETQAGGNPNRTLPEEMQKDRVALIRALTMQLHDMYSISQARSEAGRLLRSFRDLDNYTKNGAADQALLRKFHDDIVESFGGAQTIDDAAKGLEAIRKSDEALGNTTGSSLETVLREAELMGQASGLDVFVGVQEMWINAILSGTQTQILNNTMNMFKGLVFTPAARLLGSQTRDTGLFGNRLASGKAIDPIKKSDLGEDIEIENSVARAFGRDAAVRTWLFSMNAAKDMLNIFRKGDPEALGGNPASPLKAAQQKSAQENAEHVANAARDPENQSLGFSQDLMEGKTMASADPAKMMAGAKRVAQDKVGDGAYEGLKRLENSEIYQRIAGVYKAVYDNTLRLAGMKAMTAGDQFWKRTFMSGSMDGALYSYAQNVLKITDKKQIAEFVTKHRENLILPNGEIFSKHNLKIYAYERATAPAPNGLGLQKGSKEAAEAAARLEARHWDLIDEADPSNILWRGDERAAFAAKSLDEAEELVFQRPLNKDAQEIAAFQDHQKMLTGLGAGGAKNPRSIGGAYSDLANSFPVMKLFTPFIRTPFNLGRDFYQLIPVIGRGMQKHKADMISGDRARMDAAKGKQAIGWLATTTAVSLAINNRITGRGPQDVKERQALEATGWKANSILLPNGDTLEYGRLEPYSTLFKAAANIVENYNRLRGDEEEKAIYDDFFWSVVNGIGYTIQDSVGAKGMFDMLDMVNSYGSEDDTATRKTSNFIKKLFSSGVPRILQHPTDAIDQIERQPRDFQDMVLKRVFRHAVPPRRDPIFGYEVPVGDKYPSRWIKTFSPSKWKGAKSLTEEGRDKVYQEIIGLGGFIGAPSLYYGKANYDLKLTKYGAQLYPENLEGDEELWHRVLVESAKNFKTPDGTPCPITANQDAYDFICKYNGLVKRKIDSSVFSQNWKGTLELEAMPEGERQANLKLIEETVQMLDKNNNLVTLEELMSSVIKLPKYLEISADPNYVLGEKSFRLFLLRDIATRWRSQTNEELFGDLEDINTVNNWSGLLRTSKDRQKGRLDLRRGLPLNPKLITKKGEPAVPARMGVIALHWPELARDLGRVEDEYTDWNNHDLMKEHMQMQKKVEEPAYQDNFRNSAVEPAPKE